MTVVQIMESSCRLGPEPDREQAARRSSDLPFRQDLERCRSQRSRRSSRDIWPPKTLLVETAQCRLH